MKVEKAPAHLKKLRTVSWLFDELIRIPGTNLRVGLDALLGVLPGGGDVLGGAVSAYALVVAWRLGAPPTVIARMALNIMIDALVGAVPLLGDLFDAGWKANRKNLDLLERYTTAPSRVSRRSTLVVVAAVTLVLATIVGLAVFSVWLIRQLF